eukprot:CAMPEP_0194564790 /NCGR_PEP_ID=MMETSP0292-20121207/4302_1 /TAXON_ID=39354 /ORGANISM="Heterosigma akashiwo, Strain CCMP2393" /LENGTH=165 /DNA_ID=CAMNT_0039413985 /DNA_START=100 /DNA_END=595 /DNA_ORIENTATION=-
MSTTSGNFTHSTARLRRIKKLQFGVLSPDEIKQMSVTQRVNINGNEIKSGIYRYETYSNGQPVYGGPNDPRMGTFDFRARCKTCEEEVLHQRLSRALWAHRAGPAGVPHGLPGHRAEGAALRLLPLLEAAGGRARLQVQPCAAHQEQAAAAGGAARDLPHEEALR